VVVDGTHADSQALRPETRHLKTIGRLAEQSAPALAKSTVDNPPQTRAPHRCYFLVRPLGGSSIRFCSSFSACSASISNCFCSWLKLAFMARSLAPAALSTHGRASSRRCSARVVITGRTLLAVRHRGGGERTPARRSPRSWRELPVAFTQIEAAPGRKSRGSFANQGRAPHRGKDDVEAP
jgi:hypothetical protein